MRRPSDKVGAFEQRDRGEDRVLVALMKMLRLAGAGVMVALDGLGSMFATIFVGTWIVGAASAIGVLMALQYYSRDLPEFAALADYEPPVTTRVHAADGQLLAEFAEENRIFVPIEAMPRRVIQAFLAAEDKNFFVHNGIDPVSIVGAAVRNARNIAAGNDRRLQGASTITQQVAKNMLLTSERRIERKIREALLSMRIERALPKVRILELYLNEIYLGNRSFGVASAALNYFNKALDELTLEEAAYLAALPKGPNDYHPVRRYDAAVARRNLILGLMGQNGFASEEEVEVAQATPLVTRPRDRIEVFKAGYFIEDVRRKMVELYGANNVNQAGYSVRSTLDPRLQEIGERALRGGLIAYDRRHGYRGPLTRLDSAEGDWRARLQEIPLPHGAAPWQLAAVTAVADNRADILVADGTRAMVPLEEVTWAREARENQRVGPEVGAVGEVLAVGDVILVDRIMTVSEGENEAVVEAPAETEAGEPIFGLRQVPEVRGSLVAMDIHTGRVKAMVGGWSFEESEFNRASQGLRQPGSSFKPVIYLAALDHGLTPSSLVLDTPAEYDQGPGLPKWRPQNYSNEFNGPTPLRVGLEKSHNVMTVRIADYLGMNVVAEYAENLGVVEEMPRHLAASLGSVETTNLELTTAYAIIANGGKRITPTLIDRIQDRHGVTIYRHDARDCAYCNEVGWVGQGTPAVEDTREQIVDARSAYQVVSMLEGVIQRGTGRRIASLNRPLAGKTGTTNDYRDGWFIGFSPDLAVGVHIGFDEPRPLGRRESGGRVAAPVFKDFMAEALENEPPTPFRIPPGIRMVRVSAGSGTLPTGEEGERVIWEAFVPGTEPSEERVILSESGQIVVEETVEATATTTSVTTGTGGLY